MKTGGTGATIDEIAGTIGGIVVTIDGVIEDEIAEMTARQVETVIAVVEELIEEVVLPGPLVIEDKIK